MLVFAFSGVFYKSVFPDADENKKKDKKKDEKKEQEKKEKKNDKKEKEKTKKKEKKSKDGDKKKEACVDGGQHAALEAVVQLLRFARA